MKSLDARNPTLVGSLPNQVHLVLDEVLESLLTYGGQDSIMSIH